MQILGLLGMYFDVGLVFMTVCDHNFYSVWLWPYCVVVVQEGQCVHGSFLLYTHVRIRH